MDDFTEEQYADTAIRCLREAIYYLEKREYDHAAWYMKDAEIWMRGCYECDDQAVE